MATEAEKCLKIVEESYLTLLQLPIGGLRIRSQGTLARCRDFIAEATGKSAQEVQEHYEELAMRQSA